MSFNRWDEGSGVALRRGFAIVGASLRRLGGFATDGAIAAAFGGESIEVGFGDVSFERVAELVEAVAFGEVIVDPQGHWPDAERAELASEPDVINFFAVANFH